MKEMVGFTCHALAEVRKTHRHSCSRDGAERHHLSNAKC